MKRILLLLVLLVLTQFTMRAEEELTSDILSGMKLRNIGPAMTSGRIGDIAVNPKNKSEWYVAVSAGHVWKTTNSGTSFTPVFDNEGSYSIGCITIDPSNPFTVWVGTGENNSQRSVGYGDGIYKSTDGGSSWVKMGLPKSEHIAKIIVDPRNSNVVYAAAQGPLWNDGGDRGLYKTIDGGKNWTKILNISEKTGVTDLVADPRNPDVLYATSYQRRRHVFTLVDGGPESAVYKSEDAGATWNKIMSGMPGGDVGRIGLAISPVNPDVLYAIVEATESNGGFFRSTNRGASWEKRNGHVSSSPQYYQELFCDPQNVDKVFSMGTLTMVTIDGGANFTALSNRDRHVDDHALYIEPENTKHIIIGGDGGLYETFDNGDTWRFFENLPVTQFYRIQADNTLPFYWVYGGTQDNNSVGGPSRTANSAGILSQDWVYVVGGDGYEPQIDPENPNIVYGQWQYGNFVRFDKKSGELTGIQPQAEEGEELRWNWDSPMILSPFNSSRLYVAANKVYRSDDKGNTWQKISEDLTRAIDRDQQEVMGKIWEPEAVAKNTSTSLYGNIISLCESPKQEGLIYVGTDDGLIQVTEDNGKTWRKIDKFAGVPETTYVSDIYPSRHYGEVVYATFNNHKRGDFKPYIVKSMDKGKSWQSIAGNLPENENIWTMEEDPMDPNILFIGTEMGLYVTIDGGKKWLKNNNGMPKTIAVKDLDIQERESDLVVGTFGRGIYILDNYTPLRQIAQDKSILNKNAHIFKIKDALMYNPSYANCRNNEGETFFHAANPAFGAEIVYYIKDDFKSLKSLRQEQWKKDVAANKKPTYPTKEQLRLEDLEKTPVLMFTIKNVKGDVIRRLRAPYQKGIQKINWDFRYAGYSPISASTDINNVNGMHVPPGPYKVSLAKIQGDSIQELVTDMAFLCKPLGNLTLPAINSKELDEFRKEVVELQGNIGAANNLLSELDNTIEIISRTLILYPSADQQYTLKANKLRENLQDFQLKSNGDNSIAKRSGNQTPSISNRMDNIVWMMWESGSQVTETNKQSYRIAKKQLDELFEKLYLLKTKELTELNNYLDAINAPQTPGRFPNRK
jgi:photosystem II stability/assembly factor-like uncharacterized protein